MSAYMISPFGVVIIGVYSALVLAVVGLPMWRLLRGWSWWRYPTLLIVLPLLAAPWAEEIWIATNFERLCRDAGVKVHRQVEADGFLDATYIKERPTGEMNVFKLLYNDPQKLADFDRSGLKFKETLYADGSVWHVERRADGVYGALLEKPRARYQYRQPADSLPVSYRIHMHERVVIDAQGGDILGREHKYLRYPGIAEGLWLRFFGIYPTICEGTAPQPPTLRHQLFRYVLTNQLN